MRLVSKVNNQPIHLFNEYLLEKPGDLLDSILTDNTCSGTYGIEMYKDVLIGLSPTITKLKLPQAPETSHIQHSGKYYMEVDLANPSFLPLYTKESVKLLDGISSTMQNYFLQILITVSRGKWRDKAISQYEHYQKGNENPSLFSPVRGIQTRFIKVLDKIGQFHMKKQSIVEVEEKILQPNYRMEMRFILNDQEEVNFVRNMLKRLNFYNEIRLYEVRDKEKFIDDIQNRRFASFSKDIYYSKEELYVIIGSNIEKSSASFSQNKTATQPDEHNKIIPNGNQLIELLPNKEENIRKIDENIAKSLENALKSAKITKEKLKIESNEQGATLQKISVKIPKDTSYSQIKKNIENIQAMLGKDTVSVEIGDKPETVNFYQPCDNRDVVYLRSLMEREDFQTFAEEAVLPFIIGEDAIGNVLYADLKKLVHILIAGATGSGKSVFLNSILMSLLLSKQPDELIMYLIDPKKVELAMYDGIPHVKDVITDMNKAVSVFNSLIVEMERRYEIFASEGIRNLEQYNKKTNNPLPYILCVVDEFADLMETNPEVEGAVQRLGQKARAAGIHLIIATQRPSVDVITGVIKSNLPSTFCLRLKTSSDYKTVFGKGAPCNLLGNGDGLAVIEGSTKEFERFQSPVISMDEDEVFEVYEQLKGKVGQSSVEGIEIVKEESQLDKLKRIIAETKETRIGELQKDMGIRINVVSDLMKELVEEGWIEKQGRSYVVVASEDNLNEWRA